MYTFTAGLWLHTHPSLQQMGDPVLEKLIGTHKEPHFLFPKPVSQSHKASGLCIVKSRLVWLFSQKSALLWAMQGSTLASTCSQEAKIPEESVKILSQPCLPQFWGQEPEHFVFPSLTNGSLKPQGEGWPMERRHIPLLLSP